MDTLRHKNTHFGLTYNVCIYVGTYSSYSDTTAETDLPPDTQVHYKPTNSDPVKGTVYSIPITYTS